MGEVKHMRKVEALFEKSLVVDAGSISRIVSGSYSKQLIRNLLKAGKIKRLTKGFYTTHDDPSLAVFCFKPAYLGLQDALAFHNLSEQETVPIIVTAKKVRPGIRDVMEQNVLIRRLDKKYLFGFDYYELGKFHLPYSDIEKTLIDMIYFKENISEEICKGIRDRLDQKKLKLYLRAYPDKIKAKVLRAAQL